ISLLAVLCAGALQLPATLRSQEHTVIRPRAEIDRRRDRVGGGEKKVDKADKWEKKKTTERANEFNRKAGATKSRDAKVRDAKVRDAKVRDAKTRDAKLRDAKVDRERRDANRRVVEKADKWRKGDLTK